MNPKQQKEFAIDENWLRALLFFEYEVINSDTETLFFVYSHLDARSAANCSTRRRTLSIQEPHTVPAPVFS